MTGGILAWITTAVEFISFGVQQIVAALTVLRRERKNWTRAPPAAGKTPGLWF
jgi:uncharacterized membrane protein YidH (DUF202 family)